MIRFLARTLTALTAVLCFLLLVSGQPARAGVEFYTYDIGEQSLQAEAVDFGASATWLASHVGDSFAENLDHQGFMRERLANPSAYGSPISGNFDYKVHGLGGFRIHEILSVARSSNWGRNEGANVVMVMAGTNDVIAGANGNWDLENHTWDMFYNLQALVDQLKDNRNEDRPRIVVSGIPAFDHRKMSDRAKYFNEVLRDNLKGCDVFTDANFYDFYDEAAGHNNLDYMADYAHLTTAGYEMMADNWLEAISALFDESIINNNDHIYKVADYWGMSSSGDPDLWVEPYEIP